MKVIFLDVDGVLNSEYDYKLNNRKCILYAEVEDRPLALLKELVERTNAKVVISSSWRIGCERSGRRSAFGEELFKKLERRLHDYEIDIFDITPSLRGQRGDEIRQWLQEHGDVESFVILDDDSDMCEFTETNLVKTKYSHGLQKEHVNAAIQLLMGDK